jgi:hypothetical protein
MHGERECSALRPAGETQVREVVVEPAKGLSFSMTSSMLGDCITCAIEGGRDRLVLVAYTAGGDDGPDEEEDDEPDKRWAAREARLSSFSRFFSACWMTATTAGSIRGGTVSGIAESPEEPLVDGERPGVEIEDVDDVAEDENEETEERLSPFWLSEGTKSRLEPIFTVVLFAVAGLMRRADF